MVDAVDISESAASPTSPPELGGDFESDAYSGASRSKAEPASDASDYEVADDADARSATEGVDAPESKPLIRVPCPLPKKLSKRQQKKLD